GNNWVKVRVIGTKGLTSGGHVNRDGIGAIVKFTPNAGKQVMSPVLGGSSYASEHSLIQGFGLGTGTSGTVEVFWPGAIKNRLYNVAAGETVTIPEIPCDFAAAWPRKNLYKQCVQGALNQLVSGGVITPAARTRLLDSAIQAFDATH